MWTKESPAAGERGAILLVEDNRALREVQGMLLEYEHWRYVAAADGREALDWLEGHRPALVILDWRLPRVGGLEVLAAVRGRYGDAVPVLVLTAVADAGEAQAGGADAYLRKPYAIEDLVGTIRRLLPA